MRQETVYTILKNADFTEGCGPMMPTEIAFFDIDVAHAYIGANLPDPYDQNRHITHAIIKGKAMIKSGWYEIKKIQVFDSHDDAVAFSSDTAFKKLVANLNKEQLAILRKHKDKL